MNILREGYGKSRKPHQCSGCERVFPIGTKLHYQRIADDCLYTVWTCETCEALKAHIEPEEGRWDHGYVSNTLNRGETPESLLATLQAANP